MSKVHEFTDLMKFSEGVDTESGILDHILDSIPGASRIVRATKEEDKNGTDYWIHREHRLPSVSVDVKHRTVCPIEKWGSNDACIETCSVYKNGKREKIGWTLDETKRTDLVVYTWPASNGRRYWIAPFPLLCKAAQQNWKEWRREYGEYPANNHGYQTFSIYPLISVIEEAMNSLRSGTAKNWWVY